MANDPPQRLDKALARDTPAEASLSRTRLSRLIAEGAVLLNGLPATHQTQKIVAGDAIEINLPEAQESHIGPQNIPLDILFEDDDLVVINKLAGMVVHPAPGSPDSTLVNALLHHCGDRLSGVGGWRRPGIVHRIDKDTSGVLVVAKTDRAHHGLATQFEAHKVERYYRALVFGFPDAGDPRLRGISGVRFEAGNILRITTQLARHRSDRQRQAVLFQGGRHAVTRVRVIACYGNPVAASLIECWLETGRTHQIRVHLAHTGHGLIGDPVYGRRQKLSSKAVSPAAIAVINNFSRQALHASTLGFVHPINKYKLRFQAPLPADIKNLIEILGGTNDGD